MSNIRAKKNVRRVYETGSLKGYAYNEELVKPPTKMFFIKVEYKNDIFYLNEIGSPCDFCDAKAMPEDDANRICNCLRKYGYAAHVFSATRA